MKCNFFLSIGKRCKISLHAISYCDSAIITHKSKNWRLAESRRFLNPIFDSRIDAISQRHWDFERNTDEAFIYLDIILLKFEHQPCHIQGLYAVLVGGKKVHLPFSSRQRQDRSLPSTSLY